MAICVSASGQHCSPVGPKLLAYGVFYLILRLLSTEAAPFVALDVSKLHVLEVKRLSTACKLVGYGCFLLVII